jgi:hypothetical protein
MGWGVGSRSSSVSVGASAARRDSIGKADKGSLSSEIRIMATSVACGYQARSAFYLGHGQALAFMPSAPSPCPLFDQGC